MDRIDDRLEEWVQTHPWAWGMVGALVMGGIVLSMQVLLDGHSVDEAVPVCLAAMVGWFALLGISARRRARRAGR